MAERYYAHISEDGRVHSFAGASLAGARYSYLTRPSLAAEFAGNFGCGKWRGLWHDMVKIE